MATLTRIPADEITKRMAALRKALSLDEINLLCELTDKKYDTVYKYMIGNLKSYATQKDIILTGEQIIKNRKS